MTSSHSHFYQILMQLIPLSDATFMEFLAFTPTQPEPTRGKGYNATIDGTSLGTTVKI